MEKYKIQLIEVGRARVNKTFVVEAVDLPDAEWFAYKECKQYLVSNTIELIPRKEDGFYNVSAGFHKVGEVKIEEEK